jgi:hypothetical protein
MSWNTWGRWGAAMLVVGCSSKLQVDTSAPAGGTGGGGGGASLETGPEEGEFLPGNVGQQCIPSTTLTEAVGTVGQADVLDLAHCAAGLACGSDGVCGAIPDCPQATGICVVSRPNPNSSGTGGADGNGGNGGSGNNGGMKGSGGDGQAISMPEGGIQGLVADESRVYWVEYGTRDSLGNYANDGALKASDGKTTTTLSSSLRGPVALGLTSSHVYVYVDGAPLLGTTLKPQLVRVPLAGGDPELVQDRAVPLSFASAGERAFWGTAGNIYTMTSDAAAVPSIFQAGIAYPIGLVADDTNLFFVDEAGSGQIQSAPLAGGPPTSLGFALYSFFLRDDSIYGFDPAEAVLDRAPKAGGSVERVRALGVYGGPRLVGDRYFWEGSRESGDTLFTILSASFTSDPISLVLQASGEPSGGSDDSQWAANATAIYWTDGSAIYSRSLSDLQ